MTWWADEGQKWPCCLRASEDDRATYADEFACETCPVRRQHAALFPENVEAWNLYHTTKRRYFAETGLMGDRLRLALAGYGDEDRAEVLDKLALIDDILPRR